ncbi:DUF4214 domain-containing protein [Zwartia sp.]|uniref:DUF4214 domain-containing protein n=1 Tax=Zwartia sp. TaxID=2978004 RepID=UPI00272157A7|nr:DUF4214 domain-containing protein [Zwartia sp.]MDO9025283.1 DUF4214 domain-containing protein [Zwartia sp.]
MSLSYDQPDSTENVTQALENNPSVSTPMFNAISNILGLSNPVGEVVVGSMDSSGNLTSPSDQIPQMIVVDITNPAGQTVTVPISPALILNKVWIFDTDANINVRFNTTERVIVMGNGDDQVIVLGDRNTTIDGSAGNDLLLLSGGNDSITGGTGNDSILAGGGQDTIVAGVGSDTVVGGLGFDVLQVAGSVAQWTVSASGAVITMTSTQDSGNAVQMSGVNFISFGTTIDQNGTQNSIIVTDRANDKDDAMRLYQTALDRSADQAGAQYWLDNIDAGTEGFVNVANNFLLSDEYISKYGTQTNTQFVEQLYQNAFDRSADQAGLDYWLNSLNSGTSRASVLASIAASNEASTEITNVVVVTGFI